MMNHNTEEIVPENFDSLYFVAMLAQKRHPHLTFMLSELWLRVKG